MAKEFKINDILNAVDAISKIDRKRKEAAEKNVFTIKKETLIPSNKKKLVKSEILVLNEMIE
jgi:hypothetical protein|tara:strand:- start:233 stop:418 length:186 start_codon:yes stop_codon:yes gene_type:complete